MKTMRKLGLLDKDFLQVITVMLFPVVIGVIS